jgi:16S rRNA (uracil1498-N3)-methyltransferase
MSKQNGLGTNRGHYSVRWILLSNATQEWLRGGSGTTIGLSREKHAHLQRVLKIPSGSDLIVTSGGGDLYAARLQVGAKVSSVVLLDKIQAPDPWVHGQPNGRIHLILGFPRNTIMDAVVEKATELGVFQVSCVSTSRSVVRPDKSSLEKYYNRWIEIAEGACEQSHNPYLPKISKIMDWSECLEYLKQQQQNGSQVFGFFSETREHSTLSDAYQAIRRAASALKTDHQGMLTLFVGPEGGFSTEEAAALRAIGVRGLSLGPRILRVETAVTQALALALLALEE